MIRATALIILLVIVVIAVSVYGMTSHATADPACLTNSDCASGQVCASGACTTPPVPSGCASPADCAAGQVCASGACTTPPAPSGCASSADCAAGQVCTSGACVNNCASIRSLPDSDRALTLTNDSLGAKKYVLGRRPIPGMKNFSGIVELYAPNADGAPRDQQLYLEPANGGFHIYALDTENARWYIVRESMSSPPDVDRGNHLMYADADTMATVYKKLATWVYTTSGLLATPDMKLCLTARRCSSTDPVAQRACNYSSNVGHDELAVPYLVSVSPDGCGQLANTWTFTPVQ